MKQRVIDAELEKQRIHRENQAVWGEIEDLRSKAWKKEKMTKRGEKEVEKMPEYDFD